jgi:hypothetical protein
VTHPLIGGYDLGEVIAMPGRRHAGFKSRSQWKMFFANPRLRRYARDKAHATRGGPKVRYHRLPEHVSVRGRRIGR